LKRFRYSEKKREKVKKLVDYPIANLEISSFEKGKHREPPIYDLFAVANHFGRLNYGHYTAMAKNKNTQKWYLFDDMHTKQISKKQVINSNAYLLFYSKSTMDEFRR
jgi:ubiquitin C-terminal hydrolase